MTPEKVINILDDIDCGTYDCLLVCGPCGVTFFAVVNTLSTAPDVQARIIKNALQTRANKIGPGCAPAACAVPGQSPQTPGIVPAQPNQPGTPTQGDASCASFFAAHVCTPKNQMALQAFSLIIKAVIAIASASPASLPLSLSFYGMADKVVTALLAYCANPNSGSIGSTIAMVCAAWPQIKASVDKLNGNFLTAAMGSALQKIIASDLGQAFDKCCTPASPQNPTATGAVAPGAAQALGG